jgi:DNA-binding NarL/FixJ family response regulator
MLVTVVQYLHPVGALVPNYDLGGGLLPVSAAVRILIVDDSEPWRRLLFFFLQQYPAWQIICQASDGLEAIKKSRELQPDLVLLDIGLPKLNGIEAARQIRKFAPHSRILFLSENCCPDVVRAALSVGGRGYVVRSDAASELFVALESVIANKQSVGRRFLAQDLSNPTGT